MARTTSKTSKHTRVHPLDYGPAASRHSPTHGGLVTRSIKRLSSAAESLTLADTYKTLEPQCGMTTIQIPWYNSCTRNFLGIHKTPNQLSKTTPAPSLMLVLLATSGPWGHMWESSDSGKQLGAPGCLRKVCLHCQALLIGGPPMRLTYRYWL